MGRGLWEMGKWRGQHLKWARLIAPAARRQTRDLLRRLGHVQDRNRIRHPNPSFSNSEPIVSFVSRCSTSVFVFSAADHRAASSGNAPSAGPFIHARAASVPTVSITREILSSPHQLLLVVPAAPRHGHAVPACANRASTDLLAEASAAPHRGRGGRARRGPAGSVGGSWPRQRLPSAVAPATPPRTCGKHQRLLVSPRAHHYRHRGLRRLSMETLICVLDGLGRKMHLMFAYAVGGRFFDT